MPPRWLRKGSPTELKKCSEFRVDVCDTDKTDGCCGVIPCIYCIEWNPETGDTVYAQADFATNSWTATIAGAAWLGFWERNYDTDECEFVVTLDGVEIYRKSCYEGQSCRDSSDSAPATIDYVDGVITWTKFLSRPLEYVQDEETNCTVHFCDECECSCECLCVTVEESLGGGLFETHYGEICDTAYDCDPPLWEGTVGPYELSLALGRDEYGRCIITPSVDSVEQEPVLFPGCADAADVTITLADSSTITVRCKKCSCAQDVGNCICDRPIGETLTMYFASANDPGTVHEVTLTYGQITEAGINCEPFSPGSFPGYTGSFSGTLALPMGGSRSETIEFILVCECTNCDLCLYYKFGSQILSDWCVTTLVATDCNCPALLTVGDFNDPNCDLWSYQISDITIVEQESNC